MTFREWKHFIGETLDSVARELHSDTPAEDRIALQALRSSLDRVRITQARKLFELEVDRLIETRPHLHAAAHRYIGKILPPALEEAASALDRALALLERAPNTGTRGNSSHGTSRDR
jgi:hypothetical protein